MRKFKPRLSRIAFLLQLLSFSLLVVVMSGCGPGKQLYTNAPAKFQNVETKQKQVRPTVVYESFAKLEKEAQNKAAFNSWSKVRLQEEIERHPTGGYLWVTLNDFNDRSESEPLYMEIVRKSDERIIWSNSTRSGREKHRPSDYLELSNNKSYYPVNVEVAYPCRLHLKWRNQMYVYEIMTPKQERKLTNMPQVSYNRPG